MYKYEIQDLRKNKKLTQKDIAKYLNIDQSLYGKYEREYEIIPIKHLNKLCNYYNVSIDYVFGFIKESNYINPSKEIDLNKMKTRLKETRKENKITQTKLAKKLNIAQSTIAEYERGTNIIATPFLYTICLEFKVSADYLLGRIDNPKYLN